MTAFEKISGMLPQRHLGEAIAAEVLRDYRQEIAEWIEGGEEIRTLASNGIRAAMAESGQPLDESLVKVIVDAVLGSMGGLIRSHRANTREGK